MTAIIVLAAWFVLSIVAAAFFILLRSDRLVYRLDRCARRHRFATAVMTMLFLLAVTVGSYCINATSPDAGPASVPGRGV
ncbi:hypothetical protein [Paraburkholderia sp. UCT2]|uniref:hypothetical protein n=1 Tax=Paraburkholderia sp. UCT2 TaxID=2615208 RepID=UPI001654D7FC|nr:hypothetical protein [Paraburkholderia sp. UCT2]MBC8730022.1 hypothetical protein [Paraburkholderia sp. UCT2]